MPIPNTPNINPIVDGNQEKAINLIIASIAFEEQELANIINAEVERIQLSNITTTVSSHCRACLIGSGNGDLLESQDNQYNHFDIEEPSISASCCEINNTNPDRLLFKAEQISSQRIVKSLTMTADLNTLSFLIIGCTLIIRGSGKATLKLSNGNEKSGQVSFTYMFQDNAVEEKMDKIGITITSKSDPEFDFTTHYLCNLIGKIRIANCI